jgi:WD40 repeat protein
VTSGLALHWNPVWTPDGKYLYYGSNADGTLNLWRVAMDEATGKPTAAPEPLSLPAAFSGHFSVSRDGDLAYLAVTLTNRMIAIPFDAASGATGPPHPLFGIAQEILTFQPSPDERTVAFTTSSGGNENLFVANADGTRLRRLTNDAAKTRGVKWSPDGRTIYFYSNRDGSYHIWSIRADGSGISRVTDDADLKRYGAGNIYLVDVSPDGRTLLAETDRSRFVALVHLDRPATQRVGKLPFFLEGSTFSPDGTQVAGYVDDPVTGPGGVFVYSFRTGRREKVLDHGLMPVWLRSSRRLAAFEDGRISIVDLDTGRTTIAPFASPAGVHLDDRALPPQLSRDGSTLYVRQALEQGNIWMLNRQPDSSSPGM